MLLMLFYELRKLGMKPVFLLLVLFMSAVLLVRFYMSCGDLDYVDQVLYQKVRAEVSELSYDEALTKLLRDRDGLTLVTFSAMFDGSEEEQEFFSEQFAGIAEPYGMTVREMTAEYESYAKDTEERQKLQTVFTTLSDQYSYKESYRKVHRGASGTGGGTGRDLCLCPCRFLCEPQYQKKPPGLSESRDHRDLPRL